MSNKPPVEVPFASRISVKQVEESDQLAPKFDDNGCIPCVTVHAESKEILMFAFMNSEALVSYTHLRAHETREARVWRRVG